MWILTGNPVPRDTELTCPVLRDRWPTLHVPLTYAFFFSHIRRGVCHLLPQHCQHPPHALWPLAVLRLLCLAHLQRHGQVPHVSLADRGGGCGAFSEVWGRFLRRWLLGLCSRWDLALRQALPKEKPLSGCSVSKPSRGPLCLILGQKALLATEAQRVFPQPELL